MLPGEATRELCNLLIVCYLRVLTDGRNGGDGESCGSARSQLVALACLTGWTTVASHEQRPTGSVDWAKTIGYVGRASINNTTNWVCIHMVAGWTSTK